MTSRYAEVYDQWKRDPQRFWGEVADAEIDWFRKWDRVFDPDAGVYTDDTGQSKFYVASDNLVEENWTRIPEAEVIAALRRAGIWFDPSSRTGVVPHMLSCLAIDGRLGITAIGNSADHAGELQEATITTMRRLAENYD